jgi:predicted acetyltransferase
MSLSDKNKFEFEIRNIGGSDVYYKRNIGDKLWLFSTKEEFELNKNIMDKKYSESAIEKGTEIEMEHAETIKKFMRDGVSVKEVARAIAIDHLEESPTYYEDLKEEYAKGGGVDYSFYRTRGRKSGDEKLPEIFFIIKHSKAGELKLGDDFTLINDEYYENNFDSFKKTINKLLEYLGSEESEHLLSDFNSEFTIEEVIYDGKSIDEKGKSLLKYKSIFKISAKKVKELKDKYRFADGGNVDFKGTLSVDALPYLLKDIRNKYQFTIQDNWLNGTYISGSLQTLKYIKNFLQEKYNIKSELSTGGFLMLKIINDIIDFADGGGVSDRIECHNPKCDWSWSVESGGDDLYVCHKCYTDNEKFYVKGGSLEEVNNNVLEYLFNNTEDITPIKINGRTVGGIDVTTYRGDTETLRVHKMLILPEFQGKGIGAKAINKLFRENPNVKQIIGNATAESKSFWQKIGAEFHSNEHTAFTITRNPDIIFDNGGTTMKAPKLLAPNGEPSNLTPKQWKLVRTPEFKAWFGDWENDPANASKIVDENGEPLVVYHGTPQKNKFYDFKIVEGSDKKSKMQLLFGSHFASNLEDAKIYSKEKGNIYEVFLNIRNILDLEEYYERSNPKFNNILEIIKELKLDKKFKNSLDYVLFTDDGDYGGLSNDIQRVFLTQQMLDSYPPKKVFDILKNKYNGIHYTPYQPQGFNTISNFSKSYIVFDNKNIKLADGTNTTFDGSNPDIRFDEGGEVEDLISQGIVELKMFATKPEHAKEYGLDSVNPLFVQSLNVNENKRLKGVGKKVLQYIDDYAIKNGHDVVFGHINKKATMTKDNRTGYFTEFTDIDFIKHWLFRNGYSVNQENNDFHKVVMSDSKDINDESKSDINFADGGKIQLNSNKGEVNLKLSSYEDVTELVPVSELLKLREFDRNERPKYSLEDSKDNISKLEKALVENGVEEPLIIEYSLEDNSVLLIEGNHRLNVAENLGFDYLPARIVLRRREFAPLQKTKALKVKGFTPDRYGYVPSDLKPSQVGIGGTTKAFEEGGVVEGQLHSECNEETGCGEKYDVGGVGHIIEVERDEAVIVSKAFQDNNQYEIKGTPSEIASALNVLGDGKNFDSGAEIKSEDGKKVEVAEIKKEAKNTDVETIDPNSIIINRRSMYDKKEYVAKGTPKEIASQINNLNDNGVKIVDGGSIKKA